MSLRAQIELMTVPQEFSRLCDAVLTAEHGDDYLPIDDDRADRGNDGYLKSLKRIYAMHCFKRIQKQAIDAEIRRKMVGDLGKAILLKEEGIWDIEGWTFICNYPIGEEIGARVVALGTEAGIDVSWKGPDFLAIALQQHQAVREQFPDLQVNEIGERLAQIEQTLVTEPAELPSEPGSRVPRTPNEERNLLLARSPGWEFLLFAGILRRGKADLELEWHDFEMPPFATGRTQLDASQAFKYIGRYFGDLAGLVSSMNAVFDEGAQEQAFGRPGEAGDPVRIEHSARRILGAYEGLLDSTAELRATKMPDAFADVVDISARIARQPLEQIRKFIDDAITGAERVPVFVTDPNPDKEPLVIDLVLSLSLDPGLMAEHEKALAQVQQTLETRGWEA